MKRKTIILAVVAAAAMALTKRRPGKPTISIVGGVTVHKANSNAYT